MNFCPDFTRIRTLQSGSKSDILMLFDTVKRCVTVLVQPVRDIVVIVRSKDKHHKVKDMYGMLPLLMMMMMLTMSCR